MQILFPILIHGGGPYSENTAIPYLNTWGPHPPRGLSLTLLLLPSKQANYAIVDSFYKNCKSSLYFVFILGRLNGNQLFP